MEEIIYPVDFMTDNDKSVNQEQIATSAEQFFCCSNCSHQMSTKAIMQIHRKSMYEHVLDADTNSDLFVLICSECKKSIALWISNRWWKLTDVVKTVSKDKDGFIQVTSPGERLVLWCLNNIVFDEIENDNSQLHFLTIPHNEFAKIFWINNEAAGFYTLKCKGSNYSGMLDNYTLPVIDLIFVRKKYRGLGIGKKVVMDAVGMYPQQDIGFSHPVSDPMFKVLQDILTENPKLRLLLWETEWTGCESCRKNIWFSIARKMCKKNLNLPIIKKL